MTDHADAFDPQSLADALGELAWVNVSNLGDYPNAVALADESIATAQRGGLPESPWAWSARAMVNLYSGDDSDEGIRFAKLAIEAAGARDDDIAGAIARTGIGGQRGRSDVDTGLAELHEGLRQATRTGQPVIIASLIITTAWLHVWRGGDLDLAHARSLLDQAPEVFADTSIAMWLDVQRGMMLVRFDQPGAVEPPTRAIHVADRLQTPHAQELGLRLLAIVAGEAGYLPEAATLDGYCTAQLTRNIVGGESVDERLEAVLARLPYRAVHESAGRHANRREILALVGRLTATLDDTRLPA